MPSLELLYQKFKKRNFAMIAVSNDIFGAQVVKPYIQSQNLTFPIGLDPKLKVSNQFGVISLPTTFLIDPQGKIIGVLNGAENWAEPKTLLYFDQLLKTPAKTAGKQ
jgi:peroxiredoxin